MRQNGQWLNEVHSILYFIICMKMQSITLSFQRDTYVYDFVGSESNVGEWRKISETLYLNGNVESGEDGKIYKMSRTQNSIVSYDKYIIIYAFQYHKDHKYKYGHYIVILDVEQEKWIQKSEWTNLAEKSKYILDG